jgi:uncharacterized YccA/Bax inhibitor family protein
MRSNNPAFSRNEAFTRNGYATFDVATPSAESLETQYGMPSPVRERSMTLEDVVTRTGIMFAVLLTTAAAAFFLISPVTEAGSINPALMGAWIGGALIGFVLAMVISFSKTIRPGLILAYAAVEGVFIGAASSFFELLYPGIVAQAVLGTLAAFATMLVLYRSRVIRATPKFRRVLIMATVAFLALNLVNIVVVLFGGPSFFYDSGLLGVGLSLLGVVLASLFLVLDFDFVEQGIRNQLPQQFAWMAAFGLVVTLVWLYLEMLRLIAILRGD